MLQLIKVLMRITHMFSTALMSGIILFTYFFNMGPVFKIQTGYKTLHMILGPALLISGFANSILLKVGKKLEKKHKAWVGMMHTKFLLAIIFLTPVLKHLLAVFLKDASEARIVEVSERLQAYFCLAMYLYSTFAKYFREEVCRNFESAEDLKLVQKLTKASEKTQ